MCDFARFHSIVSDFVRLCQVLSDFVWVSNFTWICLNVSWFCLIFCYLSDFARICLIVWFCSSVPNFVRFCLRVRNFIRICLNGCWFCPIVSDFLRFCPILCNWSWLQVHFGYSYFVGIMCQKCTYVFVSWLHALLSLCFYIQQESKINYKSIKSDAWIKSNKAKPSKQRNFVEM